MTAVVLGAITLATLVGSVGWTGTRGLRLTAATATLQISSATPPPSATSLQTASPEPQSTATPAAVPSQSPTPITWPTPDGLAAERRIRLPILMYHHVGPLPEDAGEIRTGLTISPDAFSAQLDILQQRGYVSVSLYDLTYALALGRPLPDRPIVFTFDDAFRDVYEYAFPRMQAHGFTGTVFVPTQFIDEGRPDNMTWPMLEELHRNGWRLDPHTKTHVQVSERDRAYVVYEVLGSMETLQAHLGYPPRYFAYPAGAYDDHAIGLLKEIGFWGAVTTEAGLEHTVADAFTWGRVRISPTMTLDQFAFALDLWEQGSA